MNENIKFINSDDQIKNNNVMIMGAYASQDECNDNENIRINTNIKNVFSDNKYFPNYAISKPDNFVEIFKDLYDKMIKTYPIKNTDKEIILATIPKTHPMVIINDSMFSRNCFTFNSEQDLLIDTSNFFVNIYEIKKGKKNKILTNICCLAYTKTANNEILQYLIKMSYSKKEIIYDVNVRKFIDVGWVARAIHLDACKFTLTYILNKNIENIFKEPFDILYDITQNINKFLDYVKRDNDEKELFENINQNVKYSTASDVKFTESILNFDKKRKISLTTLKDHIEDFNESANEVIRSYFINYIPLLKEKENLLLTFSSRDEDTILLYKNFNKMKKDKLSKLIVIGANCYGLIVEPEKSSKFKHGFNIEKSIGLLKYSTSLPANVPVFYILSYEMNTNDNILEQTIEWNMEEFITHKTLDELKSPYCLISGEFHRQIDPTIYRLLEEEEETQLGRLAKYVPKTILVKEIIKEINNIMKNNENFKNKKELSLLEILDSFILNKTIFKQQLCDICFLSEKWKYC